jgi:hypothetical protein
MKFVVLNFKKKINSKFLIIILFYSNFKLIEIHEC